MTTIAGGLLTAISIPTLSSALSSHRLTASMRECAGSIRVARSTAVARNQQARVTLGGSGTTLTVESSSDGTTWSAVGVPVVLESGVSVYAVSPSNGLAFAANGTVASQVTVTLKNAPGYTRQIVVSLLGGVNPI